MYPLNMSCIREDEKEKEEEELEKQSASTKLINQSIPKGSKCKPERKIRQTE